MFFVHVALHVSLGGQTPAEVNGGSTMKSAEFDHFCWENHWCGLVELPCAVSLEIRGQQENL